MGAIVLAQNEAYAGTVYGWKDVTGEHYQFPNQYRTRIVPGTRFVYYRGARRADGNRATPEYFGVGVVGDVYLDGDTAHLAAPLRRWNADIVEYVPFAYAVPFRDDAGVFMETGTNEVAKNHWGVGVRAITEDRLQAIVEASRTPEAIVMVEPMVPSIDTATSVIRPLTAAATPLLIPSKKPAEVGVSPRATRLGTSSCTLRLATGRCIASWDSTPRAGIAHRSSKRPTTLRRAYSCLARRSSPSSTRASAVSIL